MSWCTYCPLLAACGASCLAAAATCCLWQQEAAAARQLAARAASSGQQVPQLIPPLPPHPSQAELESPDASPSSQRLSTPSTVQATSKRRAKRAQQERGGRLRARRASFGSRRTCESSGGGLVTGPEDCGQGNAGITRHRGSWGGPAVREVASHQGRGQQARGGLLRHLCRHTTRPSHCPKASSGSCPGHDMQSAREARAATQGQKSRSWLTHRRRRAQRVMRRRTRGRRTAGVVRQKGDSCAVAHRASPWVSSWRPI